MKKQVYILTLLSMLLGIAGNVSAQQDWEFTAVSDDDKSLLNADTRNWAYDSKNDRWENITAINGAVTANNTILEYTKGLNIDSPAGTIRLENKKGSLTLTGKDPVITISGVKAGQVIQVISQTSSANTARCLIPTNVDITAGFSESNDKVTSSGIVKEDGAVTLKSKSGGIYIYSISITDDDDNDDENFDDDPTPATPPDDHSTFASEAMNQLLVSLPGNVTKYYNTDAVSSVDIDNDLIVINTNDSEDRYQGTVSNLTFKKAVKDTGGMVENVEGKVNITEARGWFESAFVKFDLMVTATAPVDKYNVYIKGGNYRDYTKIDDQLVRNYGTYGRADVLGLVAGSDYAIKVVPVIADHEQTDAANEATGITVTNYDRSGFAHKNRSEGVGAYNNDGSLKANARVVYVTKNNAKTISLDVATNAKGSTSTYTGLQDIIYGYQKGKDGAAYDQRPLDIRIVGIITDSDCDKFLSSNEGIQIKGAGSYQEMNITIEGVGDDATTSGFGFLIRNCASVELRNFANMLCMDDAISIDTDNSNIWVHNLDLFYGKTGKDSDQAKGDGTIDIKADSKFITVSYNHLWDCGKSSLCGMKSETGPNWITYHHNWFDHSDSRHPRLRTMSAHVYNNYYDGNSKYGVGAAFQSNAFVENNYFRNCKYPMLTAMQGSDILSKSSGTFSEEDGGMIKSFGNKIIGASRYVTYQQNNTEFDAYEASTRDEQVPASVTAKKGGRGYDNFDTNAEQFYTYTPDAAEDVPGIVTGWYGAGRIGHGDFQWTFNNATEDTNYDVIGGLKDALMAYQTSLVGIFGDENASCGEGGDDTGGDDTGDDPGDDNPGGGEVTPVEGTVICTFDKSGTPSSNVFTVSGNGSETKGSATVDGQTLTVCLKMETSTSVKFTLTSSMKMTLYFGDNETASIKIDGTKISGSGSTYTTTLNAGAHELTKDKSVNLFAIKLEPAE